MNEIWHKRRLITLEKDVMKFLERIPEYVIQGAPVVVMDENREFSREILDLAKFLLNYLKKTY